MSNETSNMDKKLERKLAEALKGVSEKMTDEQKEQAEVCKTLDELAALAGREGVELPDELLDSVAGGHIPWLGCGVFESNTPAKWYLSKEYDKCTTFESHIAKAMRRGDSEAAREELRSWLNWCRPGHTRWMNNTYYWYIVRKYQDLYDELNYQPLAHG